MLFREGKGEGGQTAGQRGPRGTSDEDPPNRSEGSVRRPERGGGLGPVNKKAFIAERVSQRTRNCEGPITISSLRVVKGNKGNK